MHAGYFAYESTGAAQLGVKEKSSKFMSLNGLWKFDWVKNADARPVGFQNPGFPAGAEGGQGAFKTLRLRRRQARLRGGNRRETEH